MTSLKERFEASMVLAGVGDALGYKNGEWEFCRSGRAIQKALAKLGGLEKIRLNTRDWMVSDDTVMHLATAEALVKNYANLDELFGFIAERYQHCMRDMAGRAPGLTCDATIPRLKPDRPKGYVIPFNDRGGGCGAAMRSAPIGLAFWKAGQIESLVAVAIESARMSHNHPTGYLGSLATALFVSYSVQQKPLREWGFGLMETLKLAWKHVESEGREVELNKQHWSFFVEKWVGYLTLRGIQTGSEDPVFPEQFDAVARDKFYKSVSFSGWGGSSGHDAPMIAYDALLGAGDSWPELCNRGMLHGGDSDSTGIICAACWGAMRGFGDIPGTLYENLEYKDRLITLADELYAKQE